MSHIVLHYRGEVYLLHYAGTTLYYLRHLSADGEAGEVLEVEDCPPPLLAAAEAAILHANDNA